MRFKVAAAASLATLVASGLTVLLFVGGDDKGAARSPRVAGDRGAAGGSPSLTSQIPSSGTPTSERSQTSRDPGSGSSSGPGAAATAGATNYTFVVSSSTDPDERPSHLIVEPGPSNSERTFRTGDGESAHEDDARWRVAYSDQGSAFVSLQIPEAYTCRWSSPRPYGRPASAQDSSQWSGSCTYLVGGRESREESIQQLDVTGTQAGSWKGSALRLVKLHRVLTTKLFRGTDAQPYQTNRVESDELYSPELGIVVKQHDKVSISYVPIDDSSGSIEATTDKRLEGLETAQ